MLAAFSFDVIGAKEKANKKKSAEKYSRSAEREGVQNGQARFAPSTAPPFEKRKRASTLGENFFVILMVLICLSVS